MELLILSHIPTRVLENGFIPAAIDLQLKITILTDCVREHLLRAKESPLYGQCKLLECDVFNPLSVARFVSVHAWEFSGVLAADVCLRASAAVTADCLGLPGLSSRSAVLCDQRLDLRNRFESETSRQHRRIVNCSEPNAGIDPELFPATVQPLEAGAAIGGAIVGNADDLKRWLADTRYGYALVEKHREGEEVYALDGLGTPDGFIVLGGRRIQFDDDDCRTKRVQSFMPQPPRCDELLALLSELDLGLGRHHVEYAVSDKGIRIREIHNGLHDEESEFAVNAQFGGDLFRETIKVNLGMPVKLLSRLGVDPMLLNPVLEAAV